jgi:LysM repeat protein
MKKSTLIVAALLLVLVFTVTASAYEYPVKEGDSLSRIGQETGVPWPFIAKANKLHSPYLIRTGEVLQIPEKKERSRNLGDRVDATLKLTHRERISGETNKHSNTLYGSVAIFPLEFNDHYFGIGGTYIDAKGETYKGYNYDTSYWFLGPRYKWNPKEGHEFGAGIGFGAKKDEGKKAQSASLFEAYYCNTQRKLAGETMFSEWSVWGSLINSENRNSTSIGGRLYIADGEIWRLYADASAGFDSNSVVAVGLGVTDRQNIVEVGAGVRVGTQGFEGWVGPAVKPGNLLNGVVLKPANETVTVAEDDGIQPVVLVADGFIDRMDQVADGLSSHDETSRSRSNSQTITSINPSAPDRMDEVLASLGNASSNR